MVRRTCAQMKIMTRRIFLCSRGQDIRGNGVLILHRFLDESRGLKSLSLNKKFDVN
jgi:hypothetical protein